MKIQDIVNTIFSTHIGRLVRVHAIRDSLLICNTEGRELARMKDGECTYILNPIDRPIYEDVWDEYYQQIVTLMEETDFSSKEARLLAENKIPFLTLEDVLDKIEESATDGDYSLDLSGVRIGESAIDELERRGFKITEYVQPFSYSIDW